MAANLLQTLFCDIVASKKKNNSCASRLDLILTECNQFGGAPIDIDWFKRYDLFYGEEVLKVNSGVVGGALDIFRESEVEIVPLIYAKSTCPGGYITKECYEHLRGELLGKLQDSMPVDGVLLPLHGASVAEYTHDPEGDILSAVRLIVGNDIPIVATLDLHAHVTPEMGTKRQRFGSLGDISTSR